MPNLGSKDRRYKSDGYCKTAIKVWKNFNVQKAALEMEGILNVSFQIFNNNT